MRFLLAATVLALGLLTGCATSPTPPPSAATGEAATRAQLIAQADAWDQAIVRQDRAGIEANLHPGFFQISRRGERSGRAEFVESLLDPKLKIAPYRVENLEVHLHGNTALLTATTRMNGTYDGQPFSSHYRYIDVYVREGGVWKIVSVQITGIAEG